MRYTEEHEWVVVENGLVTVGITAHAADALGDIVFIELPEIGTEFSAGDDAVVIESVKAASDILAPLDGEIAEVNEALVESPAAVNADAMSNWFFKMKVADTSVIDAFMDEEAYKKFIGE